jgi:LAO/AO transport system kinase
MASKSSKNVTDHSIASLAQAICRGETKAIARAISFFEDASEYAPALRTALSASAQAPIRILGVTGSPGAGKSTLVDSLAQQWASQGERVAILAVDPSSPFSGGAVLGDRIRMSQAMANEGIFIRSLATRGALGGLSPATFESAFVLSCAGYTRLIIETVGVGQSEIDIMRIADCCALVLVPGMGDVVQSLKAGIMEIAHIFVLNKADRDGVEYLEKEIRNLLALDSAEKKNEMPSPPILKTVATRCEGISAVVTAAEKHFHWMASQAGEKFEENLRRHRAFRIAQELFQRRLQAAIEAEIQTTKLSPGISGAQQLAEKVLSKMTGKGG